MHEKNVVFFLLKCHSAGTYSIFVYVILSARITDKVSKWQLFPCVPCKWPQKRNTVTINLYGNCRTWLNERTRYVWGHSEIDTVLFIIVIDMFIFLTLKYPINTHPGHNSLKTESLYIVIGVSQILILVSTTKNLAQFRLLVQGHVVRIFSELSNPCYFKANYTCNIEANE